jgi:VanZ family protein
MATKASHRSGGSRNSRRSASTSSARAMEARKTKSLTVVAEARLACAISSRSSREARTAIRSSLGERPCASEVLVSVIRTLLCFNNVHTHPRRSGPCSSSGDVDKETRLPAHTRRRRVAAWLPVIAWAGLIFAFSAQPNLRFAADPGLDFLVRKAGHMAVFGILALLLWRALAGTTAWRRPWAWALVFAVLYAISDEFHRGFVVGRHPSAVDVGIDAAGALIAIVAVGIVRSRRS